MYYGPHRPYEVSLALNLGFQDHEVRFGEIRVAADTSLLRDAITPALRSAGFLALGSVLIAVLLAALVSNAALAPLARISAQLDRISHGEFDQKPLKRADEFGQVSTKIVEIGQQLRGVREIFSTLRENLDQILGGLEDGLLLTRDGRAVMISPAVESFRLPAAELLGRRARNFLPLPSFAARPLDYPATNFAGRRRRRSRNGGCGAGIARAPHRRQRAGDHRRRHANGRARDAAQPRTAREHQPAHANVRTWLSSRLVW